MDKLSETNTNEILFLMTKGHQICIWYIFIKYGEVHVF